MTGLTHLYLGYGSVDSERMDREDNIWKIIIEIYFLDIIVKPSQK